MQVESSWEWLPVSSGYVVDAIALDPFHYMIYWVSVELFDETPGIVRAPINDTESDEYIVTGCVGDIALSHILSKIYWTPCDSNKILRANLDGSGAEDVLSGQGDIGNLAIDDKGRTIYWSETAEVGNPLMRWMAKVSDPTQNFQDAMAGFELSDR